MRHAYFHVLVGKLAQALNIGEEEAKVIWYWDYGAVDDRCRGGQGGF